MSLFQRPKFKQLQKIWYQKLKDSGFNDAEDTTNEDGYMLVWHSSYFYSRYTPETYKEKQDYYRLASSFTSLYEFISQQERDIWNLHAEGQSLRTIAAHSNLSVYQVYKIIKKLTTIMLDAR